MSKLRKLAKKLYGKDALLTFAAAFTAIGMVAAQTATAMCFYVFLEQPTVPKALISR